MENELTVVNHELDGCCSDELISSISGLVWNMREALPCNEKLQGKVVESVAAKIIVEEAEHSFKV
jgi:hypothetical protein